MKTDTRNKFISDVKVSEKDIQARQPFKVVQEENRRFVRVEIEAPVDMKSIKDVFGNFQADDDAPVLSGMLLNISAIGALIEVDQPLSEGDVISIRFTLQGISIPDAVLGLVKRCDCDEDFNVAGIEFIDRDRLSDLVSKSELDLLSDHMTSFSDSVKNLLSKYLYHDSDK